MNAPATNLSPVNSTDFPQWSAAQSGAQQFELYVRRIVEMQAAWRTT